MAEANFGYVIAGYLDEEGPGRLTVTADPRTERPFRTVDAAWAFVDLNGGAEDNAVVMIAKVVPVGLITSPEAAEGDIMDRLHEVESTFGQFAYNEEPIHHDRTQTHIDGELSLFR